MAKIPNGIMSTTTGKVANVTASSWKGINYIKERVKPANPQTPLQQAHRRKYTVANNLARCFRVGLMDTLYANMLRRQGVKLTWQMAFIKDNINKLADNIDTYGYPFFGIPELTLGNQLLVPSTYNGMAYASFINLQQNFPSWATCYGGFAFNIANSFKANLAVGNNMSINHLQFDLQYVGNDDSFSWVYFVVSDNPQGDIYGEYNNIAALGMGYDTIKGTQLNTNPLANLRWSPANF